MLRVVIALCLVTLALGASLPSLLDDPEVKEWSGRIVGGSTASVGQFRYQVSLRSSGNAHFCGGTMVSNRWVLSAAHCTIGRSLANTVSVFGAHSRTTGGVAHASTRIANHGSYNANTLANDISMVQTTTTVGLTANINPAALASANTGGGVNAAVSGWGQTSHPGSAAANLQWFTTQTLTLADCRARHSVVNRQFVFDNTICTFTRAGQGNCMGDSGGPLAVGNTVIGGVSWGIACAQGFPDVYFRVSTHRAWISSISGL
jgi:secreted trypsin-like serine protease